MCEFVIKRIDATNADPEKDIRGCYKRGDIIAVMEDGLADTMPHLTVIKVPMLDISTARMYMDSIKDAEGNVLCRRKYRIPPNIMNTWFHDDTDTQYTITQAQWDAWKSNIEEKIL